MDPTAAATAAAGDHHHHLRNLSDIQSRIDTVRRFLSDSLTLNTTIPNPSMQIISGEIAAAISDVILNATGLITTNPPHTPKTPNFPPLIANLGFPNPKIEVHENEIEQIGDEIEDDLDVIELDAVELLAEHLHFCEFCGKGFKRDANLRMHMRAHGNKFKTLEALSKPEKLGSDIESTGVKRTRFSCPFDGCGRNKNHKKFRPLKSVICVKNHFKRTHCPKMYSCNRCNKKSFSVLADLKSHLKHCGEAKWKCSCGTSFSRKDKLFGHMALFEGHMPEVAGDGKGKGVVVTSTVAENVGWVDNDGLFDGLGSIDDDFNLQDLLADGSYDWNL
ncbi:zinc finger protein NUTCRACKER-like [Bidens hawaiensis]|uniref:zinc finger protein NUTCRACKER-like n=1 Tax=Bidens hawaiensis TaxID=980011 RepID=UPI00404A6EE1